MRGNGLKEFYASTGDAILQADLTVLFRYLVLLFIGAFGRLKPLLFFILNQVRTNGLNPTEFLFAW